MDDFMHSDDPVAPLDTRRAQATPIRELGSSERSLFLKHLLELEADDRYLRFGNPLSDLAIERYVDGIDFRADTVFGVFDDRLQLVAAGHFAPMPKESRAGESEIGHSAEFGLSVSSRARGRGLGTALFLRAASHARNMAISSLFMHCLSENRAMMRIARKAGMDIRQTHGEADAYLALKPGTIATAIEEGVQRQIALFDFAIKRQLLMARKAIGAIATQGS
jgi:RimJ/RimL family protein N-acetyltransferase